MIFAFNIKVSPYEIMYVLKLWSFRKCMPQLISSLTQIQNTAQSFENTAQSSDWLKSCKSILRGPDTSNTAPSSDWLQSWESILQDQILQILHEALIDSNLGNQYSVDQILQILRQILIDSNLGNQYSLDHILQILYQALIDLNRSTIHAIGTKSQPCYISSVGVIKIIFSRNIIFNYGLISQSILVQCMLCSFWMRWMW